MRITFTALVLALASAAPAQEQRPAPPGPFISADYATSYVRLGQREGEALLFTPAAKQSISRIALVYAHPNGNTFGEPLGPQMAARGHLTLMVNHRGDGDSDDGYAPAISQAIRYMRSLPGVEKVVLVGHSGGGHLVALYQNVAENGPAACSGPEKLYPCRRELVSGLEKPDGLVMLDPTLGAFHQASSADPLGGLARRDPALDMFAAANGYDLSARSANYSPAFTIRFHHAQARRNAAIVAAAQARLALLNAGKGQFRDDEPFVVKGMGVAASGARLYQPDTTLLSHTHASYRLYKADGSDSVEQIRSVRPVTGQQVLEALGTLEQMTQSTSVRRFLGNSAIRMSANFAIDADSISGVDWHSAMSSTPANAEGIKVPTMVLTMSCHYLVVPGEIIFQHLAARDKSYGAIEGATHLFAPCKPQYGNTVKRTFDAVGEWLHKEGRF